MGIPVKQQLLWGTMMLNHGMFGTECMFKEKHMIGLEICKQGTEVKLILASI